MNKWNTVYGRMVLVFLCASVVAGLLYFIDSRREPQKNAEGKSVLVREPQGAGTKKVDLEMIFEGRKTPVTVEVKEKQYTTEELPQVFEQAGAILEKVVLGDNASLDQVRHNLNFIEQIPDMGINVSWEVDNYEVLNSLGELQIDKLIEQGTIVELKAFLSYGKEESVHIFHANLLPPVLTKEEKQLKELEKAIQKKEESSTGQEMFVLPEELEGRALTWKYPMDSRAAGLFVLGVVGAGAVFTVDRQKRRQRIKDRQSQLIIDYPKLVSQLLLFMGAGMTVRRAWFKMAQEYEKQRGREGVRAAYEEMSYTMHEMQSGISEGECYERFGSRCNLSSYRKLGALLAQNLRKGNKGLHDLLRRETIDAFEDRKKRARKLGEEAGTKLLCPMMLMLAVVLVVIVVPAFFSIKL